MCKKYRQFHTLFLLFGLEEALEMKHNLPKMMRKCGPNTRSSACDTKETVHLLLLQSTPSFTLAGSTTDVSGQSSSTLSVSTLTSATSVTTASSNTGIFTLLLIYSY